MSRYYDLLQKVEEQPEILSTTQKRMAIEVSPTSRTRTAVAHDGTAMGEFADWLRFWNVLLKHWRISAAFAGAVMVLVILFTLLVRPVYEPTARLEIDPPGATKPMAVPGVAATTVGPVVVEPVEPPVAPAEKAVVNDPVVPAALRATTVTTNVAPGAMPLPRHNA